MSRVFVAQETAFGRKVVVKVLPPDLAATVSIDRFHREIQLSARLQHPHIVPVLAAGASDGLPYYTMPYIEGESLRARIAHTGALQIHEAGKLLGEVLSALDYAHQHGVIHRDIKPENILLTGHHAVVTDFGIAKALSAATSPSADLTRTGVVIGTPAYMAPEQASADPAVDHRADLYSTGAVAYEMLTGQPIFSARSQQALLAAHALEIPEHLMKRRESVPPALADIVMGALEKNPAARPQSAAEMLAAVEAATPPIASAYASGAPVWPLNRAWMARHRVLAIAASVGLLLLLSAAGWYWFIHRESSSTLQADAAMPSLAVLPFENLGKSDDAYFAEGMTDEISNRLGSLSGLRVIGRQSVREYANTRKSVRQIGRELGVIYLLTGTVRWDRSTGGHNVVRVSPELLRTSDGTHLWSESTEGELAGILRMQTNVADKVARMLQVRLAAGDVQRLHMLPTNNLDAYDEYLRGRTEFDSDRHMKAIPFFARAVAADPTFALALAYLGMARTDVFWYGQDLSEENRTAARNAIDSSLALNPDLAEAHAALGNFYYHAQLEYEKALHELAVAERLAPNNSMAIEFRGYVERRLARWGAAERSLRRAAALNPRRAGTIGGLAHTLSQMRRYDASDSVSRRTIEVDSTWSPAYEYLIRNAMLRNADADSALKVIRRAISTLPNGTDFLRGNVDILMTDSPLFATLRKLDPPTDRRERLFYFANVVGEIARFQGDTMAMRVASDSILANMDAMGSSPKRALNRYYLFAWAYVLRRDRRRAMEYARRETESQWVVKDSLAVIDAMRDFAYIAAGVGADDEAIAAFEKVLAHAYAISRAYLRYDPALAVELSATCDRGTVNRG